MIRILIVDDQNLVQQGIKSLLERDLDFKVIGTVRDGRNAVKQIAQIHPDIVLLDIEMPGMDGITTTKYINRVSPQTKVIILSSHEEKKYVTQALMAGAKGYLLKNSLMNDLKQAILAVNNGYSQIDSRLLAKVFDPQNIKVKKANSSKETRVADKSISNQSDLQQSLPNRDSQTRKFERPIHPLKSKDSALPLDAQKFPVDESSLVESDTIIQSEVIVGQSKQKAFSNGVADSPVLKVDRDSNQSPYLSSQAAPVKLGQQSFERHKMSESNLSVRQKTSSAIDRVERLPDSLQVFVDRFQIDRLKFQLNRYKTKLLSFIQQKQRQKLLWYINLAILGIIIVIILSGI